MGVLKQMRQKETGSSAQALRRDGGGCPCLVELGRSADLLHPLESSSGITFSKNFSGSFPELERPLCLIQMPGPYALKLAEEFCRALSSWRASRSPQCPAQGLVGATAPPR